MTDVFFDFLCPYAWRGLEMAAALRTGGEAFRLRHFSLVEGNHPANKDGLHWRLTDQAAGDEGSEETRHERSSLGAFLAAQAAALQGEDAAWTFTLALDRAHHEQKKELNEATFVQAAQDAGLNLEQWQRGRQNDAELRRRLRADLDEAEQLGVFGTPTFVLPSGEAAYYRFEHLTRDPEEARGYWDLYTQVLRSGAGIGTIKRARPRSS